LEAEHDNQSGEQGSKDAVLLSILIHAGNLVDHQRRGDRRRGFRHVAQANRLCQSMVRKPTLIAMLALLAALTGRTEQ
jgi:hypothetical protein